MVPAESEVLRLNLGDKSVYLENPLLLGGEISTVKQAKKGCLDKRCTINGITKPKIKRRRCSVITKKQTNAAAKNLRRGFQSKSMGFKYAADLLDTNESSILFNIQINKCTVLPTPLKSVENQKSPDAVEDTGKDDSEVTKTASLKPASPILMQDASTSDTGTSDVYEGKHYNRNASNISAAVSILDEVVEKFSAITILEEKETDVADTDTKIAQKDQLQTPTNSTLHENARPKNVLTDIKTIKESVSKSLSLCSSSKFSLAEKADPVHTPEGESPCSGNETVKQTNETNSGRVLSDIKLLKEMLVKSLGKGHCEEDRVVSDKGRDERPDIVKNEMPRDITESEYNTVVEHAKEDVETSIATNKMPEHEEIFGRMNISDGERDKMSHMPNSAMRYGGIESESTTRDEQANEIVDFPNTTDNMPATIHHENDEEFSGSTNISDSGRDEMPNNATTFGGIETESTTGEEQIRENVDTPNTTDETTVIIHDEDDEDFSVIMRIYKNSHIHDGIINVSSIITATYSVVNADIVVVVFTANEL